MNSRIHILGTAMVLCLLTMQSRAATGPQLSAISAIGQLNAVALQCRYLDEVRRIKEALVRTLPKQRALGVWFEQTTNDAFMDFMRQDKSCPLPDAFATQLDQAVGQLEKAFQ